MIAHLGFRVVLGLHILAVGAVLLLIYFNRYRSNLWGRFFRLGRAFHQGRIPDRQQALVYLGLGWLAVIAALIVLLFGVRATMVGR
jgi:hypothetical protein